MIQTDSDMKRDPRNDSRPGGRPVAVVVGGGIAGVAAATILAERALPVTILESLPYLGGRLGAWTDTLDGEEFQMERGFHAFFRQYYNLRNLLRRVDPTLSFLRPLDDYPILGGDGATQSFRDLPRRTPFNIIALTRRNRALGWRELRRVNKSAAVRMLSFDMERTYARYDSISAGAYLDSLNFPMEARQLLFDVFSHSFFNPEDEMSAAELLMMFHFYFTGNPEGLVFDVLDRPFSKAVWEPFASYLAGLGVSIRLEEPVEGISRSTSGRYRLDTVNATYDADLVVLALPVIGLTQVLANAPGLDDTEFVRSIGGLEPTLPFAVLRLWVDRMVDRPPFVGTTGRGILDNISMYHTFEDESRRWANEHGGSVIELHAYAVPEGMGDNEVRQALIAGMWDYYPETREANVLHERFFIHNDCPAFRVGSHATRPTVHTPYPGLALAGDFVRLPWPSALMERAAMSGFAAANTLMAPYGYPQEPIQTVRRRGLLAGLVH